MLNDGGNENGKTNTQTKKNHVSLATTTKTTTTLHVQHTSFLHFFVVFLHDYSVKCLVTRFLEGTSHVLTKKFVSCVPARFLFHCRSFSPYWPGLLEAWLVLTSVKYYGNLYILIPLNQRLALTRLRATGPWPLKFIISIFKFDLFFVFCFISRSSPFSVKTRLCCCCCFSFSKSSGGQDDHNIDVYHHVKHRLQPRHRKTDHFTLGADGRTGGRAEGLTVT